MKPEILRWRRREFPPYRFCGPHCLERWSSSFLRRRARHPHKYVAVEGTSRSSFGKCSGWWSCRSWVRVRLDSRFPQGFSPIFFCRYCSDCLKRGCATMVRVTCLSHSKPGVDFGYLSATCHIRSPVLTSDTSQPREVS